MWIYENTSMGPGLRCVFNKFYPFCVEFSNSSSTIMAGDRIDELVKISKIQWFGKKFAGKAHK
jgi:hypothetical protein